METDYFGKTEMDKTFKVEGKFKFEDKKLNMMLMLQMEILAMAES